MVSDNGDPPPIREAVGIFFDTKNLREAIDELVSSGFDRAELGLLAGEYTVKQSLGDLYTRTNEFADSPDAPNTAFVANESIGDTMHAFLGSLYFAGTTVAAGAAVVSAAVLGGALLVAGTTTAAITAISAVLLSTRVTPNILKNKSTKDICCYLYGRAIPSISKHTTFGVKIYDVPAGSPKAV